MLRRHVLAVFVCLAIIAASSACGGDDDDDAVVDGPTRSAELSPTAGRGDAIVSVDLEQTDEVQELLRESGGSFNQEDVIYADFTRDGAYEAVVSASSEGTAGILGYTVLMLSGDGVESILRRGPDEVSGASIAFDDGALVETRAAPGPDDPECCPTMLRVVTFRWDGATLGKVSEELIPNPDAGTKPTTSP